MTQHTDLLLTLAQVFVALAGFAGVVAALGRVRVAPQITAYRVRLMIAVALLALTACVLPSVLDAASLPIQAVTRLSASFLASGAIAVGTWAWQELRPLETAELRDGRIIAASGYGVAAVLVIALFAVGAGSLVDLAPAIYLGALLFCVVLCAFYFFMLTLAIDLGRGG